MYNYNLYLTLKCSSCSPYMFLINSQAQVETCLSKNMLNNHFMSDVSIMLYKHLSMTSHLMSPKNKNSQTFCLSNNQKAGPEKKKHHLFA